MTFDPLASCAGQEISVLLESAMDCKAPFEILASLRYDNKALAHDTPQPRADNSQISHTIPESHFFLLRAQWQRLQYTADFFHWNVSLDYKNFVCECREAVASLYLNAPYKIRVTLNKENKLTVQAHVTGVRSDLYSGFAQCNAALASGKVLAVTSSRDPVPDPVYAVYLDSTPTLTGPFTSFKTTHRPVYDEARERKLSTANNTFYQEVLMYNTREELTEGSITNVAFHRNGRWVTPPLSSGCLCGVVRHHLITTGLVDCARVLKSSLTQGEPVLLFNGVIGVAAGVLIL